MTAIGSAARKRPVLAYFVLTFAISWGGMLALIGPGGFPVSTDDSEAMGPFLIALLGPGIASIALTALLAGRGGFRDVLGRVKRPVSARWYAAALLPVPLLYAADLIAFGLLFDDFSLSIATTDDRVGLLLGGVAAGLMIAILEEQGWTGFAVPRLGRFSGVFQTGIIVGLAWGAWHFPMFWESDSFSQPLPLVLLLIRLFSWLPAVRILMVYVFDQTGSLLVVTLMHGGLASTQVVLEPTSGSDGLMLAHVLVLAAALWTAVLAGWSWKARGVVVRREGGELA